MEKYMIDDIPDLTEKIGRLARDVRDALEEADDALSMAVSDLEDLRSHVPEVLEGDVMDICFRVEKVKEKLGAI